MKTTIKITLGRSMTRRRMKLTVKILLCLVMAGSLMHTASRMALAQTSAPPVAAAPKASAPPTNQPAPPANAPVAAPASPAPLPSAAVPAATPQPVLAPAFNAPGVAAPPLKVTIMGMVANADPIVQGVMAFLLLCSAASWAAFIFKSFTIAAAQRNTQAFSKAFQAASTMDDADAALQGVGNGAALRMWRAAKQEWDLTLRTTGAKLAHDQTNRLLQRLVLAMGSAQERSLSQLGNWMGLLATVGSTAPFIGLFGTVWGILDSFEHISASYNTSLTVVAPGIAEALLATAVGLFAAIPATMFYNRFAREVGKVTGMLDNVTADMVVFASRDVERLHQ